MDVMLKQIYGPEDPWCHVFERLARPYMVETAAGEKIDNEAFIKSILQRQGSSTRWLMLIMSGSQVAGFAHYKISDEDPTLGEIYEFYVTPGVRCRGIGRVAVNLIHRSFLACGASKSELTGNPPAEGFWAKCGYSPTGKCVRHMQVMQTRLRSDPSGDRPSDSPG